jgi:endo-1,4-beta-xylanase
MSANDFRNRKTATAGLRAPSRRAFMAAGAAGLFAASARAEAPDRPLRKRAEARGMYFGCAAGSYQLRDGEFAQTLAYEADMLVPEYELKRDTVEPRPGVYDFSGADALMDFARSRRMAMRGHTLVWYAANPPWLEEAALSARDERIFTDYIVKSMARYRGRMHSWDVVNEAILPSDGRPDGLRDCFWLKRFGPGYIDTAFHVAREADPGALLVYNDWGCEGDEPWNDAFRAATLKLLAGFRKRRVPVDAYGLQGHFRAYRKGGGLNARKLKAFLAEVKAMGYRFLVTEFDVSDDGGPSDADVRDRAVADISARFLAPVVETGGDGILTWGLSDRFLRGKVIPAVLWGTLPRMLPLDARLGRKPMWQAIAKAFG